MDPLDSAATPDPSYGRLAPVIERSPLPMVEVQGPGHIIRTVNPAFCALLGRAEHDLLGRPFEGIVSGGRKCIEVLDRVYETGEGDTHAEPDGAHPTSAYWLFAMWPALNEQAEPERVVIQMSRASELRPDLVALNEALLVGGLRQHELREAAEKANIELQAEIAARARAEQALQAAHEQLQGNAAKLEQKVAERTAQLVASMADLEAFAYSLAHDLRAPVRAIHGFTGLVLEMPPDQVAPAAAEHLQRVVTAAIRMDSLIQDVLALTRVIRQPAIPARVDVGEMVCALVRERPELAPSRAEIHIEEPLLPVAANGALLSQCLTNLLGNAVKFVAPGASPRIRVRTEAFGRDAAAPGWVRIWIEDEGIGIPPEAHERIFEIFQRLHSSNKYEGSGIGLAIVRKAVERMGGRVGVESALGKGSRFWLELPAA